MVRYWMSLLLGVVGAIVVPVSGAIAQSVIVPDGTLGSERSTVTPTVIQGLPSDRINGGAIRGGNLFHSFQQFNIGEGRGAYFANPVGIENILSRVTGTGRSEILGRLGVLGDANLFLLNPNGIVFGPRSSLDVVGSFTATTANAIGLGDRGFFSATQPQQSALLSVAPGALLYNQSLLQLQGADITSSGNLVAGKDLTLAATNLKLQGQLQAGRDLILQGQDAVQILDSAATPFLAISGRDLLVNGDRSIDIFTLNNTQSKIQSGRNIKLLSNGEIVVDTQFLSGENLSFLTQSILSGEVPQSFKSRFGTTIYANGNIFFGDYSGAALKIEATGSIQGRNIEILAPNSVISSTDSDFAVLTGSKAVILRSGVASVPTSNLMRNIGGTNSVQTLGLTPGITVGDIDTFDVNGGDGGDIILTATNGSITTSNITASSTSPLTILGNGGDAGNGGSITLRASSDITVKDLSSSSGVFSSFGDAGNAKNGGAITLTSMHGRISAENINSSSTSAISSGFGNAGRANNGGTITLTALNDIRVGDLYSYSASRSESGNANATGNGGYIILNAINGSVNMGNLDASSSSRSFPALGSVANSGNTGNGGTIIITSGYGVSMENLSTNSSSQSVSFFASAGNSGNTGNAGTIIITAKDGSIISTRDSILFAGVSSSSFSESSGSPESILPRITVRNSGDAGDIIFSATNGNIIVPSIFSSSSISSPRSDIVGNAGKGGNLVMMTVNGNITIGLISSSSSASSSNIGTAGNGGSVTLTAVNGNITTESVNSSSYARSSFDGVASIVSARNGGEIRLSATNGNIILKRNLYSFSYAPSGNSGRGGDITLLARDGNIMGVIDSASVIGSFAISEEKTAGRGGKVILEARNQIANLELLTLSSSATSGDIQLTGFDHLSIVNSRLLTSKQLRVKVDILGREEITIEVGGKGQSGDIRVNSLGNLTFGNTSIQSDTKGSDPAGNATIASPGLITFNNSQIISNTSSTGQAGSINVTAGESIDINGNNSGLFAQTTNAGTAGNITLNAPQITLQRDAQISTTATATSTNRDRGGSITLNASNLNLAGTVGVFAETQGKTPAGTLRLNPYQNQPDLNITLTPNSKISASTAGSGNGGDLILTAPRSIAISGPGQLAVETTGSGNGGNITLSAPQVTLDNGVTLSALSSKQGTAGNITIQANQFLNTNNANITTTAQSSGGDIQIFAGNIRLRGDSDITTNVINGSGGNIQLTANSILALDDTDILSFAQQGKGGNVTLNTRAFFGQNYRPAPFGTDPRTLDGNDRVDINASGSLSSGTIVQPDTSFIQNSLNQLPKDAIDTTKLLANTCIIRKDKPEGTFYITGTGGLPNRPGDLSPSQYPTNTITQTATRPWQKGDPIVEPQGFYQLSNGRLVMSRECTSNLPIEHP